MREWQSQTHAKWYCRYDVVIVTKYRHKTLAAIRRDIGKILRQLCRQFGLELVEGRALIGIVRHNLTHTQDGFFSSGDCCCSPVGRPDLADLGDSHAVCQAV